MEWCPSSNLGPASRAAYQRTPPVLLATHSLHSRSFPCQSVRSCRSTLSRLQARRRLAPTFTWTYILLPAVLPLPHTHLPHSFLQVSRIRSSDPLSLHMPGSHSTN